MNREFEFPFERARRVTPAENQAFRAAISEQFGIDLKPLFSRLLGKYRQKRSRLCKYTDDHWYLKS
jgi:hypothetical protein